MVKCHQVPNLSPGQPQNKVVRRIGKSLVGHSLQGTQPIITCKLAVQTWQIAFRPSLKASGKGPDLLRTRATAAYTRSIVQALGQSRVGTDQAKHSQELQVQMRTPSSYHGRCGLSTTQSDAESSSNTKRVQEKALKKGVLFALDAAWSRLQAH